MYKDLSVTELAQWVSEGRDFTLLDVREPMEHTLASIPGATLIPMRDVPRRLSELEKAKDIAVMCHHGGRSANVAQFLVMQGFTNVYNIDGGIDAYARHVDRTVPRY